MPHEGLTTPAAAAPIAPARASGAHWRALLESRWQAKLQEVIELSLAYHAAAAPDGSGGGGGAGQPQVRALLGRTVAARRKLADVEEALGRLAARTFGFCEQCGSAIPAGLLATIPEARYCPRCDTEPALAVTRLSRRTGERRPEPGRPAQASGLGLDSAVDVVA